METISKYGLLKGKVKKYEGDYGYLIYQISERVSVDDYQEFEKSLYESAKETNSSHLVVYLDFTDFTGIDFDVRKWASQSEILKEVSLDILILNLKPEYKAELQFLFNGKRQLAYFEYTDPVKAKKKAFELVNQRKMMRLVSSPSVITGVNKREIKAGNKELLLIHDKNWGYQDPKGTYHYEIDLVDSNIFISRPSGFIEFDNSIKANVLFDKVVYEVIGKEANYYRVQDYSGVEKSSYSARRDFTSYIIRNIQRIDLMVFFGLNPTMKAIVKIGKMLHPAFTKVRICNTFEEALNIILNHKYGDDFLEYQTDRNKNDNLEKFTRDIELKQIEEEHSQELSRLFEYIGKILWSSGTLPEQFEGKPKYAEVYKALEVLKNDIEEILAKKDRSIEHMQKQLIGFSDDIKKYRQEIREINQRRQDFINSIHYDIRTPVQSILTAIEISQLVKTDQEKQKYSELLLESSRDLSLKMREQTDRIQKKLSQENINSSVFNLGKEIENQIEVFECVANSKDIKIEYVAGTIEDYFIGDLHKINSILDHLILNAIQNSSGGTISVETELLGHYITRQKIRINIKDQGFGMNKQSRNLVNRILKGETPDPIELSVMGFGNGLIVCQKLAELLKGKLFYTANEKGSVFSFEVTMDLGVFSRELNLLKRSKSIKHLKTIGDDNYNISIWSKTSDDLNTENLVLNQLNIRPVSAKSQDDLLRILKDIRIDLVFFDYVDEKDLYKKVELIKETTSNPKLKLCGITTNIGINLDEIKQKNILDYNLIKPYTIKNLVDIVIDAKKSV